MTTTTNERDTVQMIRRILDTHGCLDAEARLIRTHDDLFARGLTGLAAVDVLLAVEDALGITFPPAMVARSSVKTIDTLIACAKRLQVQPLAA